MVRIGGAGFEVEEFIENPCGLEKAIEFFLAAIERRDIMVTPQFLQVKRRHYSNTLGDLSSFSNRGFFLGGASRASRKAALLLVEQKLATIG